MSEDPSVLGPSQMGFAPDSVPPGFAVMKVQNPSEHWESWAAHGTTFLPHLRARDGSTVVIVPFDAVSAMGKAGYVLIS